MAQLFLAYINNYRFKMVLIFKNFMTSWLNLKIHPGNLYLIEESKLEIGFGENPCWKLLSW
jgi:hypothetical protein